MASTNLPKMTYRHLGRSGCKVSSISLGTWLTAGGYSDDSTSFAVMKAAYDTGINFFDCAEGYADGKAEVVLGKAIKHFGWKRNDIVISTKLYWGGSFGDNPVNNGGLSRKHIIEGMNASLARLGEESVDIVYAHRPDRDCPIEETVRAFNYLINTGKAYYWGTSEWSAMEIEEAWGIADRLGLIGPVVDQCEYSLLKRERLEGEYQLLYERRGFSTTPFSPLKAGILTGKYNDKIPDDSRFAKSDDDYIKSLKEKFAEDDIQNQIQKVKGLEPIAKKLDTNLTTLAMAWVLKNKNVASAITGASKPEQIYDSVRALDLISKLTDEILEEIEKVVDNKPAELTRRFF